jgi:hypothetical protein
MTICSAFRAKDDALRIVTPSPHPGSVSLVPAG